MSHDHFEFIVLLNCILNNIDWDQAPQWGKKEKQRGSNRKKYHIATCNFYFSVSDYVYTLLLQTISFVTMYYNKCKHFLAVIR